MKLSTSKKVPSAGSRKPSKKSRGWVKGAGPKKRTTKKKMKYRKLGSQ